MRWFLSLTGRSRRFFILTLSLLLPLLPVDRSTHAADFSARALGDYNQVAVIEVAGNFDAQDPSGQINSEPRRVLAREFYRTHGDDYDYLVIFTNFDVRMPSLQARAFFTPTRNNVLGIGLPLYDHTPAYSADGGPLVRLEGTIDMGNLAGHVLEPADPRFETTLRILTHEMLHRWGAYVRFSDAGSASEGLLGLDRAHWSFLLDSQGSTLYGNRWQDNGDGTYTALTPESAHPGELFGRLFNPFELYLMGFTGAEKVPPLKLIDAPGIGAAQLPAPGVTIPGILRTVSIDDIIAIEGPRIPPAAETRKELRMGFVLAVAPGSFVTDAADTVSQIAALGTLRSAWEERFAILTDGHGSMRTELVREPAVESNPLIEVHNEPLATAASLERGVAWLLDRQFADGRWQEQPGTGVRDTAEVLKALSPYASAADAVARAREWLQQAVANNGDFLARQVAAAAGSGSETLLAAANLDGGWGGGGGFVSNPLDTALALQSLASSGTAAAASEAACRFLVGSQQGDGGWSVGNGASQLQATGAALLALNAFRQVMPLEGKVALAQGWLAAMQNGDGSFGRSRSAIADSAVATLALKTSGARAERVGAAVAWLVGQQAQGGSWQGRLFATALAMQALHASQVAPDLAVGSEDIVFSPPLLQSLPGEVAVNVNVHNLGRIAVDSVTVALYAGTPAEGGALLAERRVAVAGQGTTLVNFAVPVASAGVHSFYVVVDAGYEVKEADEWNNTAGKSLVANLPPPTAGFAVPNSRVAENAGETSVPVVLSHPWPEVVTINYAAAVESSALAGYDYRPLSGTLLIPAGETTVTLDIQLIDDPLAEADKNLIITLSAASPGSPGADVHVLTLLDDEPPALTIISPQATVVGINAPALLFTSTAAEVQVFVDGQPAATGTGTLLGPLADGAHVVEVVATNGLGMCSRQQVAFTVDTSLPTVIIHSPLAGASNDPTPLLDYSLGGASGYRLALDGQPLGKGNGEHLDTLAEGQHTLVLTAWNTAGAEVHATVSFSVDSTPPKVEIYYPNGDVLRESSPKLLCALNEVVSASVRVDGVLVTTRCGERLDPLVNGSHRIEVSAVDSVGNQSLASAVFIVFTGSEPEYPSAAGWPRQAAKFYGGMAVDRTGNLYLATQDANYTLVVQKYSGQGEMLWQNRPFSRTLIPRDLAVDANGNLFVVGYDSSGDGFLYKFAAADGSYLAGHVFATAGSDFASAVQIDTDGQVVVAGDTGGDLYGAPNGTMNVWIARLDNNCRLLAGRQLTRSGMQEIGGRGGLALDLAGNAYLAGHTDSATFGTARGGNDAFVVKFDRSLWPVAPSLQFGTTGNDEALDVAVDVYGNIYAGGVSIETSYYFEKGFIYQFDASGNLLRQVTTGSQPINALACERDGTLYAVDDLGGLSKYTPDLNLLWGKSLGWNYRHQVIRDLSGDLYAAGDGGTSGSYASVIKLSDSRRPAVATDVSLVHTNRGSVILSGTLTPGAVVDLVSPELQRSGEVSYPQSGRWQMTVSGLPEGLSSVAVEATAPNGFTRRAQTRVNVDLAPPQVTIISPLEGQSCTAKPRLVYTVSDGRIEVMVNGIKLYKDSGQLLESLRPGWNTVRVEATDLAGNVGFATVRLFAEEAATGEWPLAESSFWQSGMSGDETVVAMSRDATGNLYVLGHTTGNFPGYANAGGRDPFIAKFDQTGRLVATWQFGVAADESGGGLAVDARGDLLVTWNVRYLNTKGQADYAVRMAKWTGSGAMLWQVELNSAANEQVRDLALAPNGDVLIAGETFGSLDRQRYGGGGDYFLARYSAAGAKQWVRLSNAATTEALNSVAVDAAGFIYAGAYVGSALAGVVVPEHVAVLKFDASGLLLRVEPIPLPASDFAVKEQLFDRSGRLLTAGGNGSRYFITAHDGTLSRQMLEFSSPDDSVDLAAMTTAADGGLYLAGRTAAAFAGNRHFGGDDGLVIKHAPTGLRQWSLQFGSSGNDSIAGLVAGEKDVLWVAGHTVGQLGPNPAGLLNDLYLGQLIRPDEVLGPRLTLDSYPQLTNSTMLLLSGTTTPGATVAVKAIAAGVNSAATVSSDGQWQLVVTGLVPNSENHLAITASNEWGTASTDILVSIDTVPPLLSVDPLTAPVIVPTQTLSGRLETGANLVAVYHAVSVAVMVVSGQWTHAVDGLSPGENQVTLRATDAAGNTTTQTVSIEYRPPPPPTVEVAPAVLGEREATELMLSVRDIIPNGSSVVISRIYDLNGNGRVDSDDPLVEIFTVTDGEQPLDLNRPGDADGQSDEAVTVKLNGHFVSDRLHAAGKYLFEVAAPGGKGLAGFAVTQATAAQTISGTVRDEAGAPIAGALIELTDRWQHSYGFARSDQRGIYRFAVAGSGRYQLWPTADGYAGFRLATEVMLVDGEQKTVELAMQNGSYRLSGTVYRSDVRSALPGITVRAVGSSFQAVALTDMNGRYELKLPAGSYQLSVGNSDGSDLAGAGLLGRLASLREVSLVNDLGGIDLTADAASDFLCGVVRSTSGAAVAGVPVQAVASARLLFSAGLSDRLGRYCVGIDDGAGWTLGHPESRLFAAGWVGGQSRELSAADLTVYPLDALVEGRVSDDTGKPLEGVVVTASHPLAIGAAGETAADGSYRLGLSSEPLGSWSLLVDGQAQGYQTVTLADLNVTTDAVLTKDITMQKPALVNSIVITKTGYDPRKKQLSVEATSSYADARLQVEGFGAMTFVRILKGRYVWNLNCTCAVKPATVTVFGPEGRVTAQVQ